MCGIAGFFDFKNNMLPDGRRRLDAMGELLAHRGPDDDGIWRHEKGHVGFAHRRLSVIDLSMNGHQPMHGVDGSVIVHNGEIYNFQTVRQKFESTWDFKSRSDTETILASYRSRKDDVCDELNGMFAFAIWDEQKNKLFLARDRCGIKPLYYAVVDTVFYFASEAKALLPFLPDVSINPDSLSEYLMLQMQMGDDTLFNGVRQVPPGFSLSVDTNGVHLKRYWDIEYRVNEDISAESWAEQLGALLNESVSDHLVGDVPIGAHLSGGIDSSLIASLASGSDDRQMQCFHGRFTEPEGFDESSYAREVATQIGGTLNTVDITADDFVKNIENVIYHLDFPVAGPGAFAQYMVSKTVSEKVKVVLGGQGGDELFAGYARYLLAYFEQSILSAIDDTYHDAQFVVTPMSIIPNLSSLREYKPMIKMFWKEGLFGPMDLRYLRLIDRTVDMKGEVISDVFDRNRIITVFQEIFNNQKNTGKNAYLDKMMHFDFKCLLPALLQVEDRMSAAFGLESRVPFLDHRLVEFLASVPAIVKFKDGVPKCFLRDTFKKQLPPSVINRRDKMGFPVPLADWFGGPLSEWLEDTMLSQKALERPYIDATVLKQQLTVQGRFSRNIWGLLSLELWQQKFIDHHIKFDAGA